MTGPFTQIDNTPLRTEFDQPYVHAFTDLPPGVDKLYVGYVDRSQNTLYSTIATVDVCLDAKAAMPIFTPVVLNPRPIVPPQDGYEVRRAAHRDATVYIAYKGYAVPYSNGTVIANIVVARDDNWGSGLFKDLTDPSDGKPGRIVAPSVRIFDSNSSFLGNQRLNNDLSIAVDPNNSDKVYIVWGDNAGSNYTLHVRRSVDKSGNYGGRGNDWSVDLLTVDKATLASLAINSDGTVGFMYQKLVAPNKWETHFQRTTDNTGTKWDDIILASTAVPADPMADYSRLIVVDRDFYGVFPAWNIPDPANYPATPQTGSNPNGAKFLRNTTKTAPWELRGYGPTINQRIDPSVDAFFFMVVEDRPAPPTGLTATVDGKAATGPQG